MGPALTLENQLTRAEILPRLGGRVQHLVEKGNGRELLYVTAPKNANSGEFLTATTGGWDLMFPNDEPWRGHPDHGRVERAVHGSVVVAGEGGAGGRGYGAFDHRDPLVRAPGCS